MATDVLTRPKPADAAECAAQHRWLDLPRQKLDLNGPAARPYRRFDRAWIERPIFEAVLAVANEAGDRIAVDDGARQLTFRDVRDGACRLAHALATMRLAPGAPIGILLPNDANYPVGVLGALAAGHACVLLDTNYPAARNAAIVADAGIAAVIVGDGASAPEGVPAVSIAAASDAAYPATPPAETALHPDAPAFIVYTSGSTGLPKGIALAQRTFLHRSGQLIDALHLNGDDRMMPLGSPCTVAGLLQMFEALLVGATLVKVDLQRAGIGLVLDTIERVGATTLLATPALLRSLCRLEDAPRRLRTLRCVHAAGDVLLNVDVAGLRRHLSPDCLLLVTYGATEAPAMGHWFIDDDAATGGARVASGYPLPDYRYALLDDDGMPGDPGEPGELVVASRYTALGEWQGGRLVPGRFEPDPSDSRARILRTGDLVRLGAGALITVLGRKDRLVKIRGMRVEPYEVECALRRSPEIADAAVLVRRDGEDAVLVAFVVLAASAGTDLDALRTDLRHALPAYMQPARIHAIEKLPLLPGHKIDDKHLAAVDDAHVAEAAMAPAPSAAPAAGAATHLAAAWTGVLDRTSHDADVPFDAAGGDSLALLMLVCELEKRCGVKLPLLHFELAMRPSDMARALDAILAAHAAEAAPAAAQSSSLVLLKPGRKAPAVFLMHGLGGHVAELAELVRHLACAHPVYALQLPGLAPDDPALDRIEDMAQQFVAPIREAEPDGPYLLVGYSLGGLVAFDLACRLEALGRETRLLLLDTHPDPRFWPLTAWLGHLAERARVQCRAAAQYRPDRVPAFAGKLAGAFVDHLRARRGLGPKSRIPTWMSDTPELHRVRAGMVEAKTRFRPSYYPRTVAFVQPETRHIGSPVEPLAAWRGRVAGLAVRRAPGDHFSMAMQYAGVTGGLIDAWIAESAAAPALSGER